jgi:hypothetical protein
LPEARLSDHASFWDAGLPAVMVTDTAFFRNPNYHLPTDTIMIASQTPIAWTLMRNRELTAAMSAEPPGRLFAISGQNAATNRALWHQRCDCG